MSKLSRTKPSTLYKAHIFLILFLLSVCNPMYVAGAAALGVTLPTTGLAATPGVKLPTTGLAATPVPVPRTPSKSAVPLTLGIRISYLNLKFLETMRTWYDRESTSAFWTHNDLVMLFGVIMYYIIVAYCFLAPFLHFISKIKSFIRNRKTSNGKNDTHNHVRIFYGSVLLVSCVLITLMLIYLYADAEDFS